MISSEAIIAPMITESVTYSPVTNLPQINSDSDNSVRTCLLAEETRAYRKRALANSPCRAKPVSLRERHSAAVRRYVVVLTRIRRISGLTYTNQSETLYSHVSVRRM